jgi:hypothetical protein
MAVSSKHGSLNLNHINTYTQINDLNEDSNKQMTEVNKSIEDSDKKFSNLDEKFSKKKEILNQKINGNFVSRKAHKIQ